MRKLDPITAPFTVIVDGREQAHYSFQGLAADADKQYRPLIVTWEWGHLKTGDYSIKGFEDLVTVERKSLEDLYSTLGQRRDRFEREHLRMAELASACVVIEADWHRILRHPPVRSRLNPKTVIRTAISWGQKYGVPWYAMGDRALAEAFTFRYLEKYWEHAMAKEKDSTKAAEQLTWGDVL